MKTNVGAVPDEAREQEETPRRPYETPALAWEQPLEVGVRFAGACGKFGGAGGPCVSPDAS